MWRLITSQRDPCPPSHEVSDDHKRKVVVQGASRVGLTCCLDALLDGSCMVVESSSGRCRAAEEIIVGPADKAYQVTHHLAGSAASVFAAR